ncbi:FG-GAP repeat protein [Portibacter marinus]|uniref:FG-GAP repeat protein n=1 Tax=Portibacter marinus TaxID=2898660 RepID=UPI001F2C7E7C|nr:FG-GAP repeat protein [Portibacter marinus]
MKHLITTLLLISLNTVDAQKVGINTTDPQANFDVRADQETEQATIRLANSLNSMFLEFSSGGTSSPNPSILFPSSQSLLFGSDANTFTERMRIGANGKVGIGVVNPQANLDLLGGNWDLAGGSQGDLKIGNGLNNLRIGVSTGGSGAGDTRIYSSNNLFLGANGGFQVWLDKSGNTGFGASNPSQKVQVNGKIKIGDDATAPSAGTIRFNTSTKSFEGYDGGKWINFGGSGGTGGASAVRLPDNNFSPSDLLTSFSKLKSMVAAGPFLALKFLIDDVGSTDYAFIVLYEDIGSGQWQRRLTLQSEVAGFSPSLGDDMALSTNRLLIGAYEESKALEYIPSGGSMWTLGHTYSSPNGSTSDRFGFSVDLDGDQTIIGAPLATENTVQSGAAYIFNDMKALQARLTGPAPAFGHQFGKSVAINTTRAIVGAPTDESATVFNKVGNFWSTNTTFRNQNPGSTFEYGRKVDIQGVDFIYISDLDRNIESYAVEDSFWELKEVISATDPDEVIFDFENEGSQTLLTLNIESLASEPDYIRLFSRAADNTFSASDIIIDGFGTLKMLSVSASRIYYGSENGVFFIDLKK